MIYNEYLKQIKKEHAKTENLKAQLKDYDFNFETFLALRRKASETGDETALKEYTARRNAVNEFNLPIEQKIARQKVKLALMESNADYLFFVECVPAILTQLEKLNNKPFGEKTADNFRNYFKDNFNLHIWVHGREISIQELYNGKTRVNGRKITIYTRDYNKPFIGKNNRVNGTLTLENVVLSGNDNNGFIEDVNGRVNAIYKAYAKINALKKDYDDAIHNFNSLRVGDKFRYIEPTKDIYSILN